jgi:hypothetical protein
MGLFINGFCQGLFDHSLPYCSCHMHRHSCELIVHCCNILHLILSFYFHCALSWQYVCNTTLKCKHISKIEAPKCYRDQLPYLKFRKNKKFRIDMQYLCGYLLELQKVNRTQGRNIKFITLNCDYAVATNYTVP